MYIQEWNDFEHSSTIQIPLGPEEIIQAQNPETQPQFNPLIDQLPNDVGFEYPFSN